MPGSRETSCAICGADLEPGHFKQLHPQYAKVRRAFWTLLALYLVVLLAIPYGIARVLSLAESLVDLIVLPYAFAGLVALLGPRLWVEKRERDAWKRDHPISLSGLKVEIAFTSAQEEVTINELVVATRSRVQAPIDESVQSKRWTIPVRILRPLAELRPYDSLLDLSNAVSLGSGSIRRI